MIDQLPSQIRNNAIWLLGLLPIVFAAFRLVIISGGDRQLLSALVHDLDVTSLVVVSAIPLVPVLVFLAAFQAGKWSKQARAERDDGRSLNRATVWFVVWLIVGVLWWTSAPIAYVLVVAVCGVLLAVLKAIAWAQRSKKVDRQKVGCVGGLSIIVSGTFLLGAIYLGFVLVILRIFLDTSPWIPLERICVSTVIQNPGRVPGFEESCRSGYVLHSDVRWTRYFTPDRHVIVVASADVTSRTPLMLPKPWYERTGSELFCAG